MSAEIKRLLHRVLRRRGVQLQRFRDPYVELKRLLGSAKIKTAVDGGAYHGGSTEAFLGLFPACHVHAFEPHPETFAHISRRFDHQPRVSVHQKALSAESGQATFRITQKDYTSSLLNPANGQAISAREEVTVSVTTLDAWSREFGVDPEVVKLDLQGNELAALRGAKDILASGKLLAVLAEVNFQRRYDEGCLYYEVADHLARFGLHLHRMYEIVSETDGRWRHADALFLNREAQLAGE